jgi:hypothetical protein
VGGLVVIVGYFGRRVFGGFAKYFGLCYMCARNRTKKLLILIIYAKFTGLGIPKSVYRCEQSINTNGIRFILDKSNEGNTGRLVWGKELSVSAIIDWQDEVVRHGLACPIKYVRVVRRKASSPKAHGTDSEGYQSIV